MDARLHDLDGQRTITIDVRETTVYMDAGPGGTCWEFDKAILLHAIQVAFGARQTCGTCKVALALVA